MDSGNPYMLSPDEVERFAVVFGNGQRWSEMLEDSAVVWREKLWPVYHSMESCRLAFLRCMIEPAISSHAHMEELPSLARYLCMQVEQRVVELDA